MSQSNYNIPNDSAPAVRAQLNSVFGSIATNNSGPTAPTTTFAYQWWYDTTTNILKMRNAADSAWIDIALFDQTGGTFRILTQFADQATVEAGTDTVFPVNSLGVAQAIPARLNATGSAPIYAARAWVNFNGTGTVAIRASGNVSSITDNGVGDYTVNFTTAMPDADFAVVGQSGSDSASMTSVETVSTATGSTRINVVRESNGGRLLADSARVNVAIFR
jgi:hypothetical protein